MAVDGASILVSVYLGATNQSGASFQPYYKLDGGAPVATAAQGNTYYLTASAIPFTLSPPGF